MSSVICVTGGAGFIGSHVAEALTRDGHQVLILDDLSSGRKENIPAGAELVVADIRSDQAANLLIERGVEVLVHHAAQMDVRRSVADPRFDADVNIGGLLNLLEASRIGSVRQVIFASTGGAIYGEQDVFPADEEHAVRPLSPYGVSKLASERYLFFYNQQYGLDATCLRYANIYGPRQSPHGEAGVVAIFAHKLLANVQPTVNGDGKQTRDYVYVGDVVRANLAVLGLPGFRTYNVGTAIETDVNELFDQIRTAIGMGPPADHGLAKAGEQLRSCITSELIESELGLRIGTPFDQGIQVTADWFKEQAAQSNP